MSLSYVSVDKNLKTKKNKLQNSESLLINLSNTQPNHEAATESWTEEDDVEPTHTHRPHSLRLAVFQGNGTFDRTKLISTGASFHSLLFRGFLLSAQSSRAFCCRHSNCNINADLKELRGIRVGTHSKTFPPRPLLLFPSKDESRKYLIDSRHSASDGKRSRAPGEPNAYDGYAERR